MEEGLTWNGDRALEDLLAAAFAGEVAAAELYAAKQREVLRGHDNEGPSLPGDTPHGQSLAASLRGRPPLADTVRVVADEDAREVDVGSEADHALALELGTSRMAARPSWEKTATDNREALADACAAAAAREMEVRAAKVPGGGA